MEEEVTFGTLDPRPAKKDPTKTLYIGSDESLKGDSFGGLTVAGVLADENLRERLTAFGVCDSKRISNTNIPLIAQRVREVVKYSAVYSIFPEEYNKFSQTGLMNRYHNQVADDIIRKLKDDLGDISDLRIVHIVDKYPGATVGDVIETKAESQYPEVAAASILAREVALEQFRVLSERAGFRLPLGSTHVQDALVRLKREGLPPAKFVKLHFKNVQRVLQGR
ncbi:MAG: hypothetical protein ACOCWQ_06330 [Nanoarchaeota archaeon]